MTKLNRLCRLLAEAGFTRINARLADDGDIVAIGCLQPHERRASMVTLSKDQFSKLLRMVSKSGFAIGLGEFTAWIDGGVIGIAFLTRPLAEVCGKAERPKVTRENGSRD